MAYDRRSSRVCITDEAQDSVTVRGLLSEGHDEDSQRLMEGYKYVSSPLENHYEEDDIGSVSDQHLGCTEMGRCGCHSMLNQTLGISALALFVRTTIR